MTNGADVATSLLAKTKCRDLITGKPVVEIDAKTPIAKACMVRFRM